MDFRVAILLDQSGRVAQTTVLADDPAGRAAGHRVLERVQDEVEVFAERVRGLLRRERELN
jgi:hypothetical protein